VGAAEENCEDQGSDARASLEETAIFHGEAPVLQARLGEILDAISIRRQHGHGHINRARGGTGR